MPASQTQAPRAAKAVKAKPRKRPKIAFIGWNPAQFRHFAPIAAQFARVVYVIEQRAEAAGLDFTDLPGKPNRLLRLTAEELRGIDGRFDVLVCQAPFAGMEYLRRTRLAMLQVGYGKERWNFAPWRSLADLCLTFGNYATRKLAPYAPCLTIGNPRYAEWHTPEFQQAAAAKYAPQLDPNKPTLLYAPTWGATSSLEPYAAALAGLCERYNVICQLHPRSEAGPQLAAVRQAFTWVCTGREDIAELLAVAQVLITDASGAMFDAVFCRKPVILLETAGAQPDGFSLEFARRSELGRVVNSTGDLATTVTEVVALAKPDIGHLESLRGDLFAKPDGAALAAKQALVKLAAKPQPLTQLQQSLREAARASLRYQDELTTARSWRGFLRHHMARVRAKLPFRPGPEPSPSASASASAALAAPKPKATSGKGRLNRRTIQVDYDMPAEDLDAMLGADDAGETPGFVHVSHGPNAASDAQLVSMARNNPEARATLVTLARAGYFVYGASEGVTRVVRADLVKSFWRQVIKGAYQVNADDLVHTVTAPLNGRAPKRLLVVLSSMGPDANSPLLERYFVQNFPTLQKFLPPETAVLRIADFGGVMGAFYLDTAHRPHNAQSVQNLITEVRTRLGIEHDAVALYGGSKGGTGALYHGLRGGYRFVAVDPIVSDDYYERKYNDWHFTRGEIFPVNKEENFARLFEEIESDGRAAGIAGRAAVICSDRSPQFPYISGCLFERFGDRMMIRNSQNPQILDHPDVSATTINNVTMLLNMHLYGMTLPCGVVKID